MQLIAGHTYTINGVPFSDTTKELKYGYYSVKVVNSKNCSSQIIWNLKPNCEPIVFIPSATGVIGGNNVFKPSILYADRARLTIYNRWGKKIFEAKGISLEWLPLQNGIKSGEVFIYLLEVVSSNTGEIKYYRGTITVL
jgi:hypothetical protein